MGDESVGSAAKIEDLKEKLQKDPGSRMFLQLAEEFRKAGRFEESIAVCLTGLERHPSYTSARVTLARAYLGAKRLDEAKSEFEKVLAAVPDNVLANRHLGDLYYEEGRAAAALERYRVVQMLSAPDEEVASRIARLESGGRPAEPPLPEEDELGAFMDLKIDESVILNADMVAAALGKQGRSALVPTPPPGPAAPPVAVPPVSANRGETPGATRAPGAAAAPGGPAAMEAAMEDVESELGLGAEDFSDFSSPTVMLNVSDLARLAGVPAAPAGMEPGAAEPELAEAAPSAPPEVPEAPRPVVAAATPAGPVASAGEPPRPDLPSYAARTAAKFGISRYAGDPEPPRAVPPVAKPAPVAPLREPAPPVAAARAPGPAQGMVAEAPDDLGAMDDFSEFAAPTVMMNVGDLLKAAGVAQEAEGSAKAAAGTGLEAALEPTPIDTPIVPRDEATPVLPAIAPGGPVAEVASTAAGAAADALEALPEHLGAEPDFAEAATFAEADSFDVGASPANLFTPDETRPSEPAEDTGTRAIPIEEIAALRMAGRGAGVAVPAADDRSAAVPGGGGIAGPASEGAESEPVRPVSLLGDDDEAEALPATLGDAMGEDLAASAFAPDDLGAGSALDEAANEDLRTMAFGSTEFEQAQDRHVFGEAEPEDMAAATVAFGTVEARAQEQPAQAPGIDRSSRSLGVAYLEQGRLEEALASFEKYLAVDPDDAEVRRHVSALRARMEPAGARAGLASDRPPPGGIEDSQESMANGQPETPEERRKKIQKLSNWLSTLKKS